MKPFSAKELLARVSTHLELSTFRRELERMVHDRTVKVTNKGRRGRERRRRERREGERDRFNILFS